jgi:hypothetical protein
MKYINKIYLEEIRFKKKSLWIFVSSQCTSVLSFLHSERQNFIENFNCRLVIRNK